MSENEGRDPSIHYCREVRLSYGPRRKTSAISGARSAFDLAKRIIDPNADREHFAAIYLDSKHVPLAWRVIAIGTATACLVHPREVFRPAIHVGATACIVVHNHPSGDKTPSAEDSNVTKRLSRVGELLGIPLLDHLIIGGSEFFSFNESGRTAALSRDIDALLA